MNKDILDLVRSKYHLQPRTLYISTFFITALFIINQSLKDLSRWHYTQHLFNYQIEFVKRGFLGEVLRTVTPRMSPSTVLLFSIVVLTTFCVIYLKQVYKLIRIDKGLSLFFLLSVSSPATLRHFIWDIGRFDIFNFILFFFALFHINKSQNISSFLISLLSISLMLLVHEAAFFMFIPPICMFWIYKEKSFSSPYPYILFFISLIETFFISTHGTMTSLSFKEHLDFLVSQHDGLIDHRSLKVLHFGGLTTNVHSTLSHLVSSVTFFYHLLFTVLLFPFFKIVVNIFKHFLKTKEKISFTLMLSCFSAIALYPIGQDFFRWWSVAITIFFFVFIYLIKESKVLKEYLVATIKKDRYLYIYCILSSFVLGPLGLSRSFRISKSIEAFFTNLF